MKNKVIYFGIALVCLTFIFAFIQLNTSPKSNCYVPNVFTSDFSKHCYLCFNSDSGSDVGRSNLANGCNYSVTHDCSDCSNTNLVNYVDRG